MSSVAITAEGPRRTPLACGALGRADPAIARRLAAAMPVPVGECHADDASLLMLDREPIRWRTWRRRGLAWSESVGSRLRTRDWTDLARAGSAAGLVLGRSGPMLHTSASGVAPLYYASHDGAVYFASRIDPLARALPGRLTVDWDAWSSILCLKYPLGTHTPFAEIRRMPPSSTLVAGRRKGRLTRESWPWAEVEPTLGRRGGGRGDRRCAPLRARPAPRRERRLPALRRPRLEGPCRLPCRGRAARAAHADHNRGPEDRPRGDDRRDRRRTARHPPRDL